MQCDINRKYWRIFLSSFRELTITAYWLLELPCKSAGIGNIPMED